VSELGADLFLIIIPIEHHGGVSSG